MRKRKILITGAISLLGQELLKFLGDDFHLIGTYHKNIIPPEMESMAYWTNLDITQKDSVKIVLNKYTPDVIIHLAALSNIDYCERIPSLAKQVNIIGTKNICQQINNKRNVHFIFASSNAVFSGMNGPYRETTEPHPLNFYGKTKYAGEQLVLVGNTLSTVFRSSTLLGWPPTGARNNDLTYYYPKILNGEKLNLVNDKLLNPVSVNTAAKTIKQIILKMYPGIIHIGGESVVNRYQLIKLLMETWRIGHIEQLTPVTSNFFRNISFRPERGCLLIEKLINDLHIYPTPLRLILADLKKQMPNKYRAL